MGHPDDTLLCELAGGKKSVNLKTGHLRFSEEQKEKRMPNDD